LAGYFAFKVVCNGNTLPFSIPLVDAIRRDYEQFRFDTHHYVFKGLFTYGN